MAHKRKVKSGGWEGKSSKEVEQNCICSVKVCRKAKYCFQSENQIQSDGEEGKELKDNRKIE